MIKIKKSAFFLFVLLVFFSILFGAGLGWCLSETKNIKNSEFITEFNTALPTKLLDINGVLITVFASVGKREIIS